MEGVRDSRRRQAGFRCSSVRPAASFGRPSGKKGTLMKKLDFDLDCPNCNRKFKQRVEDMRPGRTRKCPYCNLTIKFEGDDGRTIQRGLDDIERTLKQIEVGLKF